MAEDTKDAQGATEDGKPKAADRNDDGNGAQGAALDELKAEIAKLTEKVSVREAENKEYRDERRVMREQMDRLASAFAPSGDGKPNADDIAKAIEAQKASVAAEREALQKERLEFSLTDALKSNGVTDEKKLGDALRLIPVLAPGVSIETAKDVVSDFVSQRADVYVDPKILKTKAANAAEKEPEGEKKNASLEALKLAESGDADARGFITM